LRQAWRVVQARRRPPNPEPWLQALRALTWSSRRDIATNWALGVELADHAAQIITEAAAEQGAKRRARLLAATDHALTYDVLGTMGPVRRRSAPCDPSTVER
jgi:hypothetical protein